MEEIIRTEIGERDPSDITELRLKKCRCASISGFTYEFPNLEFLDFTGVGLQTLKGFPILPGLKILELANNKLSDGLQYLTTSPKLIYVNLSGNNIKDLETLKPLAECKYLSSMDLFDNEIFKIKNYREEVFEVLPSLKYLDSFDLYDVDEPLEEVVVDRKDRANSSDFSEDSGEESDEEDENNDDSVSEEDDDEVDGSDIDEAETDEAETDEAETDEAETDEDETSSEEKQVDANSVKSSKDEDEYEPREKKKKTSSEEKQVDANSVKSSEDEDEYEPREKKKKP